MRKVVVLPTGSGLREGSAIREGSEMHETALVASRTLKRPRGPDVARRSAEMSPVGTLLLEVLLARSLADRTSSASALRRLVDSLTQWAPRLLRRKFHGWWSKDVSDDAIQHLLLAITEGKADHLTNADEARAAGWLCRVLLNFTLDQIRREGRAAHVADVTLES